MSVVDPAAFREAMSRLPCGVAVVTAMDGHGVPRGFTCTSLCSVSVTPPLLLTCVHRDSGTLAAALGGGAFAVNVLRSGSRTVSELFASLVPDKFRHVPWRPGPVLAQPWLADAATALLECSVVQSHDAGDHVVLVGLVGSAPVAGGAALVYCERSYRPGPAAYPGPAGYPNGHQPDAGSGPPTGAGPAPGRLARVSDGARGTAAGHARTGGEVRRR